MPCALLGFYQVPRSKLSRPKQPPECRGQSSPLNASNELKDT